MLIKKIWLLSHNVQLLDEDRDLWLINDPLIDSEGFDKQCYYIATPAGPDNFETIASIGSSYSTYTEICELVDEWMDKNVGM